MSASAAFSLARSGARRTIAACGLAAGGAIVWAAFGAPDAQAQANPCAIYGAGFVPVNGSDTCVRIGGRVRVDGAFVPSQNVYGPAGAANFAPGALDSLEGVDRHLRLPGGPQSGMPRTR